MQVPSMLRVAPSGIDSENTRLEMPSFFSHASMLTGIEALLDAIENTCTITGAYFLKKGSGFSRASASIIRQ